MAFLYADRVRETTTTTGTGDISLDGAVTGFQDFATGIGASNTLFYSISHRTADEWEVGFGTLDGAGTTLARTAVQASSNSGAAVNFSAGTKDVFVTEPAAAIAKTDLVAGGRLTLATGEPYQTGTTSGTDLYYTPAVSSTVYLWTGDHWAPWALTADLTIDNTGLSADTVYDVSVNWNSGAPTLVLTAWASSGAGSSTRSTALTYQNQIPLVSGRRYIGTVMTDGSGDFADSGTERYVWNAYNRAPKFLAKQSASTTWTYNSTTYHDANASADYRVSFVVGIDNVSFCEAWLHISTSHGTVGRGGISVLGLNTTGFVGFADGQNLAAYTPSQVANQITHGKAHILGHPLKGYHYLQWAEIVITGGTATFYGFNDRAGIQGFIEC